MANLLPNSTINGRAIETIDGSQAKVDNHAGDYVKHPGIATTTNTGNAYVVTLTPVPTSYVNGMGLVLTLNADITAPSTVNVNSLGAKSLKTADGKDFTKGKANGIYTFRYNTVTGNFMLQGEGGDDLVPLINSQNNIFDM